MADPLSDLQTADEDCREAETAIADYGEPAVERVAEAHARATGLLDRYEGKATGTGDFEAYLEFEGKFADLVKDLPDELPERDAFERAEETLDRRRISEKHFEQARSILEAPGDVAGLLDDREASHERYRDARKVVARRIRELDDRIADLERIRELGDADLSAPVENLWEPIEAYNQGVASAFADFRRETSARDVVRFLDATANYPLVAFDPPPEGLRTYVLENEVGDETVPDLLSYASYSRSKLDHYVEDAAALKRNVAPNETYLDRLDASPLEIDWPPRPAADLRWWCEEAVRVVDRFAPPEVVSRLRDVRALAADEARFERLRSAARARDELTDDERARLERGEIDEQLERAKSERERFRNALDEYPER